MAAILSRGNELTVHSCDIFTNIVQVFLTSCHVTVTDNSGAYEISIAMDHLDTNVSHPSERRNSLKIHFEKLPSCSNVIQRAAEQRLIERQILQYILASY